MFSKTDFWWKPSLSKFVTPWAGAAEEKFSESELVALSVTEVFCI